MILIIKSFWFHFGEFLNRIPVTLQYFNNTSQNCSDTVRQIKCFKCIWKGSSKYSRKVQRSLEKVTKLNGVNV